jgi:SagB-type dehydrogenase family enzyme
LLEVALLLRSTFCVSSSSAKTISQPWVAWARNITLSDARWALRRSKLSPKGGKINSELLGLKMRRSPHVIMYFRRGRLIVENYMMRRSFQIDLDSLTLLSYFSTWRTASQALRSLSGYTRESVFHSIQRLKDSGLLITEGSGQDKLETKFGKGWLWPTASRYYHFSTKIDEPHNTTEEITRYYIRHLKGKKQPPIYKSYPRQPKITLVKGSSSEAPFFGTLRKRRSTRELSGKPISFNEMSTLAYYTWGRISSYKTPEFGELLHKTSPSAGARHPIETYAIVNKVNGIDPGIYHYSVRDHALELLKAGDFRERCVALTAGHSWTTNASAVFVMTAVVARTAWKYRVPRVYRAFFLDAGHLSQSFLLVATALGLGAFCIGIVRDDLIERELNLDGISETVLFVVGVGQPLKRRQRLSLGIFHDHSQLQPKDG